MRHVRKENRAVVVLLVKGLVFNLLRSEESGQKWERLEKTLQAIRNGNGNGNVM